MIEGGRRDRGKLADDVRFSRWFYSGEDHDFLVYEVSYPESYNQPIRRLYVAAPTGENVKGRYHQHTDALLLASGAWTKELHDEITSSTMRGAPSIYHLLLAVQSSDWWLR